MKTIINNLRFALLLGFIAIGMTALAQAIPNVNKMSATTQLLLAELDNANQAPLFTTNGPKLTPKHPGQRRHRLIASPDTINGSVFISAFVRVNSDSDISDLEALGVQIESKFDNGLLTTLIPVDKINEVAAIEGVKKISVASLMRPLTDKARQTTNTDDVLTLSADALAANLSHIYDGTGVILGVIDGGIDYQHSAFKDKNGNTIIPFEYDSWQLYYDRDNHIRTKDNLFVLKKNGRFGVIDIDCNTIIPHQYDMITITGEGPFLVKQGEFFGLMNHQGEFVIPLGLYDRIEKIYTTLPLELYRVYKGHDLSGIVDANGSFRVPCQFFWINNSHMGSTDLLGNPFKLDHRPTCILGVRKYDDHHNAIWGKADFFGNYLFKKN